MTLRATSSILNVPMLCFTCIGEQTVSLVGVGDLTVGVGLRAGRASSRLLGLNNSLLIYRVAICAAMGPLLALVTPMICKSQQ